MVSVALQTMSVAMYVVSHNYRHIHLIKHIHLLSINCNTSYLLLNVAVQQWLARGMSAYKCMEAYCVIFKLLVMA